MAGYILYSSPDEEKKKEVETLEEQIKKEEEELKEEYCKLGEAYFEENKMYFDLPAEFSKQFDVIKKRKETIEQYKKKAMSLKKVKICPYCNSEIPLESVFCIMCGKKVQEIQPKEIENTVTCKYCGTVLPAGSKFCGYCAHSLVEEGFDTADQLEDAVVENSIDEDPFSQSYDEDADMDDADSNIVIEEQNIDKEDIEDEEDGDLYATTAANIGWNAVKICPRCNKKLDRASRFCTGCGMQLPN